MRFSPRACLDKEGEGLAGAHQLAEVAHDRGGESATGDVERHRQLNFLAGIDLDGDFDQRHMFPLGNVGGPGGRTGGVDSTNFALCCRSSQVPTHLRVRPNPGLPGGRNAGGAPVPCHAAWPRPSDPRRPVIVSAATRALRMASSTA